MAFGDGPPRRSPATDGTRKLLLGWPDAAAPRRHRPHPSPGDSSRQTECVMIPSEDRRTPSRAGRMPVGCRFCASGLEGLEGNLTRGRIVEQAWTREPRRSRSHHQRRLHGHGRTAGELRRSPCRADPERRLGPLDLRAEDHGLDGRSPGGDQRSLASRSRPPPLSLHAPNDDLRREIIPWAEYSTVDELRACASTTTCGREITLEYILLGGVNDQPEHARQLAAHAATLRCNINLIRYNEVADLPFRRPDPTTSTGSRPNWATRGERAHPGESRADIAAACGQLRHERRRSLTGPADHSKVAGGPVQATVEGDLPVGESSSPFAMCRSGSSMSSIARSMADSIAARKASPGRPSGASARDVRSSRSVRAPTPRTGPRAGDAARNR